MHAQQQEQIDAVYGKNLWVAVLPCYTLTACLITALKHAMPQFHGMPSHALTACHVMLLQHAPQPAAHCVSGPWQQCTAKSLVSKAEDIQWCLAVVILLVGALTLLKAVTHAWRRMDSDWKADATQVGICICHCLVNPDYSLHSLVYAMSSWVRCVSMTCSGSRTCASSLLPCIIPSCRFLPKCSFMHILSCVIFDVYSFMYSLACMILVLTLFACDFCALL